VRNVPAQSPGDRVLLSCTCFCLEGGPYPGRQIRLAASPSVLRCRPWLVHVPFHRSSRRFPTFDLRQEALHAQHDSRRPSRSGMIRPQTSTTNFDSQRDHILHADCARNRSNIFSRRKRHFYATRNCLALQSLFELPLTRSVRGPCLGGERPVIVELGGV
jgi:hypothetical protein